MKSTSPTTVMAGIFAIFFGLAAAYGVRVAMTEPEAPPAPKAVQVQPPAPRPVLRTVVMAKRNIAPNTCISAEDVSIVQVTDDVFQSLKKEAVSPDAFPFEQAASVLNRVTCSRVMAGKWITNEVLYEFGKVPTLEDKLQPGETAMAIPVDTMTSVAGFLHPDARVNIAWTPKESVHPDLVSNVAITIYKNVRVLTTSQEMNPYNPGTPREIENITIAVTQRMANELTVLQQKGTFGITMTAPGDDASVVDAKEERSNLYEILGLTPPEETLPGEASTDAWTGTHKRTNDFNTKEVLEAHNATRVVMNGLKPIKRMPKRSEDPDTMIVN